MVLSGRSLLDGAVVRDWTPFAVLPSGVAGSRVIPFHLESLCSSHFPLACWVCWLLCWQAWGCRAVLEGCQALVSAQAPCGPYVGFVASFHSFFHVPETYSYAIAML
ncbi:hypothetical protein XENOCAPTIV_026939 [Xenoophorus captivus]|uniref:Uncharacterized protein n=1 Tax=Xenoophorus captivus TaxID=1517983 RepID=A0ABV0S464_9TELE